MFAINKIGIYDLRYTLLADLNTPKGLNLVWDDVPPCKGWLTEMLLGCMSIL